MIQKKGWESGTKCAMINGRMSNPVDPHTCGADRTEDYGGRSKWQHKGKKQEMEREKQSNCDKEEMLRRAWSGRTPRRINLEGKPEAAVLVPFVERDGELHILFEVRARFLKTQPGEICFPGGTVEPGESPLEASVRETQEELLVERSQIEVLAPLDYLVTPGGLAVRPFAAFLKKYQGTFSTDEVERTFTVPLRWFEEQEPERYKTKVKTFPGEDFPYHLIPGGREYNWREGTYEVYFYRWGEEIIWGMTAKILCGMVKLLGESAEMRQKKDHT